VAKIFLFNPPDPQDRAYTREGRCTQEAGYWATQWPPLSLATSAALLENDNHSLKVVDFPAAKWRMGDFEKILGRQKPDIAIWSTGTPTLGSDLDLAATIKKNSPKTTTGVIGTHVSVQPAEVLSTWLVDVVIRREPEETIRNLCRQEKRSWQNIPGISYREPQYGDIFHNPDAEFIDPAKIPSPAWHYLDLQHYRLPLKGQPFLIVAPIRGCPYPCSFCTATIYYGSKPRQRPVEKVVDEIETNTNKYGVRDYFIWADTFTADKQYVKQFCNQIVDRGIKISWTCNSRTDTIDPGLLQLMKKAGLWLISYGLESGSETILKNAGKNITLAQSKLAVTWAHRLGIKTCGHFILGLPGETESTLRQTLKFSLRLPLDIAQFYAAAPFPGTQLYKESIEQGWLSTDTIASQSRAVINLPGLPAQKVNQFQTYAYRKFYLRPKTVYRLFKMAKLIRISEITFGLKRYSSWGNRGGEAGY
jgi:radical SAM superfamily enzyme YgiQ (UPF0313 family)